MEGKFKPEMSSDMSQSSPMAITQLRQVKKSSDVHPVSWLSVVDFLEFWNYQTNGELRA